MQFHVNLIRIITSDMKHYSDHLGGAVDICSPRNPLTRLSQANIRPKSFYKLSEVSYRKKNDWFFVRTFFPPAAFWCVSFQCY